ncbi:MAG TPA: 50S ribosomal protein L4 [Candidatus Hydrogenedens sp.]|nr:50S ribosomal protein L4 [Candidatus Hydrogenedens sp.]HOK10192.1 50S ribosomal protein L4 [Candidatus Hydrogenedens sp.]HOL20939.1 50S ribosomal protein L4 [Candidatus Hydrogenedens sp.]HPP59740.1 50S ribosomal protein L4 [Candidatus Hydrogenedens sp.]
MAVIPVIDTQGQLQYEREVKAEVFDAPIRETLVYEVVKALRSSLHTGQHKTKNRGEVSGGGKKPYRQKGTGNARHGSIREPQMRGGGIVFGPRPRDYRIDVPVKMKRLALCSSLSDRLRNQRLFGIAGLKVEQIKTKAVAEVLARINPEKKKTLFITQDIDKNLLLSTRNIPNVEVKTAMDVNAYDVLWAYKIYIQEEAIPSLEERLS